MNAIVSLKKVTQKDFDLFKSVLNNYASSQKTMFTIMDNRIDFAKDLSICVELWYDFNTRTAKQNVPVHSTVNLSLHKAIVLLEAVKEFCSQRTTTEYERNRCNMFIMAIDPQIPTGTQLIC